MTDPAVAPEAIRQRLHQLRIDLEARKGERARRQSRVNLALQPNVDEAPPTPRQVAELAAARAVPHQVQAEIATTKAEMAALTDQLKRR
jgi:hypothetical protein